MTDPRLTLTAGMAVSSLLNGDDEAVVAVPGAPDEALDALRDEILDVLLHAGLPGRVAKGPGRTLTVTIDLRPDLIVKDEGTVIVLITTNERTRDWILEHCHTPSWAWMNRSALAVHPRYAGPILEHLASDGFHVHQAP